MPQLALPFKDKDSDRLRKYSELIGVPGLVVIDPDGKTLQSDPVETIEEHGVAAYPSTPEKYAELAELEKTKMEAQTLESILVSSDRDYVISKDGSKALVSTPFEDDRKAFLGIPAVVASGPNGRTVSTEMRQLMQDHGVDAYPSQRSM